MQNIELFTRVVALGSFSQAAREMRLSTATATRHINNLEQSLGVKLLLRSTRQLTPTDAGRLLYERYTNIVQLINEANDAVTMAKVKPKGLLRISGSVYQLYDFLAPQFAEFLHQYPDIQIRLVYGNIYPDMIQENFDLALRNEDYSDYNFTSVKLMNYAMWTCATRDYLEEHGYPESPVDLKNHNCIVHEHNVYSGGMWMFDNEKGTVSIKVTGNLRVNNAVFVREAGLSGLGVVHLPKHMVVRDVETGQLVKMLDGYQAPEKSVYLVYPRTNLLPAKTQALIRFLT